MKKYFSIIIALALVFAFSSPVYGVLAQEEPDSMVDTVMEDAEETELTSHSTTMSGTTSFELPEMFRAEESTTSTLEEIPNDDLSSFETLIFDVPAYGSISFAEPVDLSDPTLSQKFMELDKYVKLGEHFVDIDTNTLPELNVPAKITFRNVEAESDNILVVLKDGNDPQESVLNLRYNPSTQEASFDVTDFSRYELKVIDQNATYENPFNGSNLNNSGLVLVLIFGSIATAVLLVYLLEKNKGLFTGGKSN